MSSVLIIEDDNKIAMALSLRLTKAGFKARVASDAIEGVCKAVQELPDLILLDLGLPMGGGFSVLEELGGMVETRDIPVIVVTGNRDLRARVKAKAARVVSFFCKPYAPGRLLEAIGRAVGMPADGSVQLDVPEPAAVG